uniref:non-muscle caldesmon-like n=1 Tax=Monopterus albus TaxID=43700 RepID=UPI0009B30822|nr:non-muscle caldesmon-like [Monopterus albus]
MSNALLRRNSSKQGLQNLMRLTAQRSIEDAEEVERERRQRAREALRQSDSGSMPRESSPDSETPAEENMYESELKPCSSLFLEEDEGFSDWTQRRDGPRQQCLQVLGQGAKEGKDVEEDTINKPIPVKTAQASIWSTDRLQRHEEDTDGAEMERSKEREEEAIRAERSRRKEEEVMTRRREEIQRPKAEAEKRKEVKVSYTSRIFLKHEPKHSSSNEDTTSKEVTTHIKTKGSTSSSPGVCSKAVEPEEVEAIWETEQRLEKIRRSLQVKENQELEQLRQRQAEAEQEFEELKRRREERRRLREEEEQRREEEEEQRLAKEEEEKRRMKEGIEKRRMEAAERMKSLSTSSAEGDELFSPRAPTHKISESQLTVVVSLPEGNTLGVLWIVNSFKKTQHLVLLSKIDDKLEQYTHAVEMQIDDLNSGVFCTDVLTDTKGKERL